MNIFLKGVGFLLIVSTIICFVFLIITDYETFVNFCAKVLDIPESRIVNLRKYLTPSTFKILPVLPLMLSISGVLLSIFSKQIIQYFKDVGAYFSDFFSFYKKLSTQERLIAYSVIGLSFLFNISNILIEPVFVDEASTFNRFTKGGILTSITYYPEPNNHVFHSFLTNLTYHLPFSNKVVMRLPNLLIALLSSFVFFYFFSKLLSKKIALFVLPLFLFIFSVAYYAYQSRGYALIVFAFLVCFYCTIQILYKGKTKAYSKYLFFITISGIIGFFTMPSFLYPYFTCVSFLFIYLLVTKNQIVLKRLIISGILCVIMTSILYTPILIFSGLKVLIANEHVVSISRTEVIERLYNHLNSTSKFLVYLPLVYVLIFLAISAFLAFKSKTKSAYFSLYCIITAPILLILHSVIPFERTWSYLIVPIMFLLGFCLYLLPSIKKASFTSIIITNFLVIIGLGVLFNYRIDTYNFAALVSGEVGEYFWDNNAKKVISNHFMLKKDVQFLYEDRGKSIEFTDLTEPLTPKLIKEIESNYDYLVTIEEPKFKIGLNDVKYWGVFYQGKKIYTVKLK